MANNTPAQIRTRQSVWKLDGKNDALHWYAQAVGAMRKLPVTDPTSWRYQAAVHGYQPGSDPNHKNGEPLPSAAQQTQFWNQCQHQSWYFLPWHRGYLAAFEAIVAAAVVRLGGPANWALPYWNYSDKANPKARLMHPSFVSEKLPDGTANPLWVAGRNSRTGDFRLKDTQVSLEALVHSPFAGAANGGDPGFGGPKTVFSHFGGTNGRLENLPHNVIHVQIGGLMSDPDTAALDPIFWLHHANIDRLWEVWRKRNASFVNPTDRAWVSGVTFALHDGAGNPIGFTCGQMVDTKAVMHGYQYDDVADPVRTDTHLRASALWAGMMAPQLERPAMVGATQGSVKITGAVTTTHVALNKEVTATARAMLADRQPVRTYLNLENITGAGKLGNYEVYVDVDAPETAPAGAGTGAPGSGAAPTGAGTPGGAAATIGAGVPAGAAPAGAGTPQGESLPANGAAQAGGTLTTHGMFAGLMPTFGVQAASRSDAPHGGSGVTCVLDITDIVAQLSAAGRWDAAHLHVTFARDPLPGEGDAPVEDTQLSVGRISVYHG